MTALIPIGEKTPPLPGGSKCIVQTIRIELSERDRDGVPVAACSIATVEGTAAPICNLARELLRLGITPTTQLSIWRARTKCFHDLPVSRWAERTVDEGGAGAVFRRYKPFPGRAVVSQGAESDGRVVDPLGGDTALYARMVEIVRALGADRFPPTPLQVMP